MTLLPGGEQAAVDPRKIREYILNPLHPVGKHKARVFAAKLGLIAKDEPALSTALAMAASAFEAHEIFSDEYGTRYVIDFDMEHENRTALIRSAWLVPEEGRTRFLTCCVLRQL